MFLELRLKISNFIRNNRRKIIVVIFVFFFVIVLNYYLGHRKVNVSVNTTYTPHELVMSDSRETVPEKDREPIEKLIDDFVNYCNKKEYKNAYELLSSDCKENLFDNNEDNFKIYVDEVFPNEKIYSLQSYSIINNDFFIYNIKILNNVLASGLTGEEFTFYEEKYGIQKNEDSYKLTIGNYMGKEELKKVAEDDNLKIRVTEKTMYYGQEIYTVKITNKTEHSIVMKDNYEEEEIFATVGSDRRTPYNSDLYIVLKPGETNEYKLYFNKFYDESNDASNITFNSIRILDNYSGILENEIQEKEIAVKVYSLSVPLQ